MLLHGLLFLRGRFGDWPSSERYSQYIFQGDLPKFMNIISKLVHVSATLRLHAFHLRLYVGGVKVDLNSMSQQWQFPKTCIHCPTYHQGKIGQFGPFTLGLLKNFHHRLPTS